MSENELFIKICLKRWELGREKTKEYRVAPLPLSSSKASS